MNSSYTPSFGPIGTVWKWLLGAGIPNGGPLWWWILRCRGRQTITIVVDSLTALPSIVASVRSTATVMIKLTDNRAPPLTPGAEDSEEESMSTWDVLDHVLFGYTRGVHFIRPSKCTIFLYLATAYWQFCKLCIRSLTTLLRTRLKSLFSYIYRAIIYVHVILHRQNLNFSKLFDLEDGKVSNTCQTVLRGSSATRNSRYLPLLSVFMLCRMLEKPILPPKMTDFFSM